MSIFEKLNPWEYEIQNIYVFATNHENGVRILYFKENNFENLVKLQSIVNNLIFFIKISCQTKESPLSKPPPSFSLILLFLEKIFLPHSYCQIRGTQSPIYKRGGRGLRIMNMNHEKLKNIYTLEFQNENERARGKD